MDNFENPHEIQLFKQAKITLIKFSKKLKKTIDISLILVYNRLRCQETTDCCGSIAQLGEHLPYKQGVTGSSPVVPTTFFGPVVQLVRTLACHARGRRFEPDPGRQNMRMQLIWQSATLPRWRQRVRAPSSAPVSKAPYGCFFFCHFLFTVAYTIP